MKFCVFRKSVEKTQVSLKRDKNSSTSRDDRCTSMVISVSNLLVMRNVWHWSWTENQNHCSVTFFFLSRSQWPRGLRRRIAAVHLLRLRVRIPPGAEMSVTFEFCVLWRRGLCDELITRPEESYRLRYIWVWSRNLVSEEALAHWGAVAPKTNKQTNKQNSWIGHRWQYGAYALESGFLRLQTHTHNM